MLTTSSVVEGWEHFLFDIESDGLLDVCTKMWIVHIHNLKTNEKLEWLEGDLGWQPYFKSAKKVVGHFITGFDLQVLKKLFDFELSPDCVVVDTLILSQVLDYRRFGDDGHSLGRWGEHLGRPKQEHEDWSQFSEEMRTRCQSDVVLNLEVYAELKAELKALLPRAPKILPYLDAEHAVSIWCAEAEREGWPFDMPRALELKGKLEHSMQLAYDALTKKLGTKTIAVDKVKGVVETKRPRYLKNGAYDVHTAKYFGIHPFSSYDDIRPVEGDYCRVAFEPLSLDSVADVKIFLFRHGWVPLEWNYKIVENPDPDSRKKFLKEKTSPKITEDSLEFLGGDGKLYADFAVAKSRLGILKTWIEKVDSNGKLHGSCICIGTPSMRARHNIIVNVPSTDSPWGREMRELFTCAPGWKLVGCDSSGNQARGLAHYLQNAEFVDTLLNGDIHTYNANALDAVLADMGIDWDKYLLSVGIKADEKHTLPQALAARKRSNAKRILYAFLFGASGEKLWGYIFSTPNKIKGNKLKAGFLKAVPGFEALIKKLENIFGKTSQTGDGYIPSIAGTRLYVDSFHKLLVYLLQSTEKATCSAATMLVMKSLKEANIPFKPCIFMHDEIQFQVPEEFAEQAGQLGKKAFQEGPKLFGITIMDGDFKVGNNWYDTH